jgi:malate dehydrogenase (oxaloacetate-decarboxylating)(NADP+)
VSGCGAAGFTCALYAIHLGIPKENIIACDIHGTVHVGREDLMANPDSYLHRIAIETDKRTLKEAIVGADVFLGLSVGGLLSCEMLLSMREYPLVFALANPHPEIEYRLAKKTRSDVLMGTGW